jgi:pimeloyl-ACP methyl ester carboxylesterase
MPEGAIMSITLDAAELSGGVRLPYAEQGGRDGVPVVLLHGLSDSCRSFEPVLEHLAPSVHAYAVTQRGQGDASRPGSYRLDDLVGDLARFMDAVGLSSAVICGHSMGSIVASRFAILHPDRVAGLVVIGGATSFTRIGLDAMNGELDALGEGDYIDYLQGFQESTLARPVPADFLEMVVSESAKVAIPTLRALLDDACLVDFSDALGAITAPTLLMWGELDAFCPRGEQEGLLAAIAQARLSVYAGAGHALHWEEPERFAAELTAFCRTVSS